MALDSACSETTTTPTDGGTADTGTGGGEILIGMSNSLTGGLAGLGLPLQDAARVAEREINAKGKVLGRNVKIEVVDDASDREKVKDVVNALLAKNPAGILGPLSSGQVLNVHEAVAAKKVVQISATATSPLLTTQQKGYFFRTAAPDDFQGRAITKFIYDGVAPRGGGPEASLLGGGCRKAAIVNGDDGYGNALAEVVKATFTAKPGTSVGYETKVPTTLAADYNTQAAAVVAARPDCLVLIVYSDVGAQFLRNLKSAIAADSGNAAHWAKFYVTGSDGEFDTDFIPKGQENPADPKSANSTEGTFGTAPDPAPATPDYAAFKNIYQSSFPGKEPDPYTAHQYDAVILLALAIEKAKTATDGAAIKQALMDVSKGGQAFNPAQYGEAVAAIKNGIDIDYRGASGAVDFDDKGNVKGDYAVWKVVKQADGTFKFETVASIKADDLN